MNLYPKASFPTSFASSLKTLPSSLPTFSTPKNWPGRLYLPCPATPMYTTSATSLPLSSVPISTLLTALFSTLAPSLWTALPYLPLPSGSISEPTPEIVSPLCYPCCSFACTTLPHSSQILMAGGGSRHFLFSVTGSRLSSMEKYDIGKDE